MLDRFITKTEFDAYVKNQPNVSWRSNIGSEPAEIERFLTLLDTPATYLGAAAQFVQVNAAEDALEFNLVTAEDIQPGTFPVGDFKYQGDVWLSRDNDKLRLGEVNTDYTIAWDGSDAVHTIVAGSFVFTGGAAEINNVTISGDDIIVPDEGWIGISNTDERIIFDTAGVISITGATLRLPSDAQELQFGVAVNDYTIQWDGNDAVHTIVAGDFVFLGGMLGVGLIPLQKFEIGSADNSNRISIYHDDSDAYFNIDDGAFIFQTTEGTHTDTVMRLKPKGNANVGYEVWDRDGSNYGSFWQADGATNLTSAANDVLEINFSNNKDVSFFKGSEPRGGSDPGLWIYGHTEHANPTKLLIKILHDGNAVILHSGDGSDSTNKLLLGAATAASILELGYEGGGQNYYAAILDGYTMAFGASLDYGICYYPSTDRLQFLDGHIVNTNVRADMDSTGLFTFYEGVWVKGDSKELQFGAAINDYTIQWDGNDAVHTVVAGDFKFMGGMLGIGTIPAWDLHVYDATGAYAVVDAPVNQEVGFGWFKAGSAKWQALVEASSNDLKFFEGVAGVKVTFKSGGIVEMPGVYGHDMDGETIRLMWINDSGELGYDSNPPLPSKTTAPWNKSIGATGDYPDWATMIAAMPDLIAHAVTVTIKAGTTLPESVVIKNKNGITKSGSITIQSEKYFPTSGNIATADSATATTLRDAALAVAGLGDDYFNDCWVFVIHGAGTDNGPVEITDYIDATGDVVVANWPGTQPDNTSRYLIIGTFVDGEGARAPLTVANNTLTVNFLGIGFFNSNAYGASCSYSSYLVFNYCGLHNSVYAGFSVESAFKVVFRYNGVVACNTLNIGGFGGIRMSSISNGDIRYCGISDNLKNGINLNFGGFYYIRDNFGDSNGVWGAYPIESAQAVFVGTECSGSGGNHSDPGTAGNASADQAAGY